jgi:hypothetical protein
MRKASRIEFARAITGAGRVFTKTLPVGVVEYYVSIEGEPLMIGLLVQAGLNTYRYLATTTTEAHP